MEKSSESLENITNILKQVRKVEIKTKRLVNEALSGSYHSVFKGQGINFEEVREYAHGDDIRFIDWNVTAKTNQPHIKVFREERELNILIMVDLSSSGVFGSTDKSKRQLAGELASVLAFSATRNNDKVGLLLFTDKVEKFIPPKKGKKHVLRIIRDILFFEPEGKQTFIENAIQQVLKSQKKRTVVFLLSDFLIRKRGMLPKKDENSEFFKLLSILNKKHDLICVFLSDPRENELPNVGIISLEDSETGEILEINTSSSSFRNEYKLENENRIQSFEGVCSSSGIDLLNIKTDQSYMKALRMFLSKRKKRKSSF